jgi:hypothetical protein
VLVVGAMCTPRSACGGVFEGAHPCPPCLSIRSRTEPSNTSSLKSHKHDRLPQSLINLGRCHHLKLKMPHSSAHHQSKPSVILPKSRTHLLSTAKHLSSNRQFPLPRIAGASTRTHRVVSWSRRRDHEDPRAKISRGRTCLDSHEALRMRHGSLGSDRCEAAEVLFVASPTVG